MYAPGIAPNIDGSLTLENLCENANRIAVVVVKKYIYSEVLYISTILSKLYST